MGPVLDTTLLTLLAAVAYAVSRSRDLFTSVVLFAIYSLLCASLFTLLAAPDVAITEAAVGVGMSTILMLTTMRLVGREERRHRRPPLLAGVVVVITGAALVWGFAATPAFGAPDAPAHMHVAPHYLQRTPLEVGVPNVVTAVLVSYRGFDTLGELAVIFTAGVGVLALLTAGRPAPLAADRSDGK